MNDFVPNVRRNWSQPSTQPGTDQASGPRSGMASSFLSAKYFRVAFFGAGPLAFRPDSLRVLAS